jgi:hypothetical protein
MREVPDVGEHLKSASRHGVVSRVPGGDRNDPVLLTPDQQDGSPITDMVLAERTDRLAAVVHHRAQRR